MSTKIYTGFCVDTGSALSNLNLLATIKDPIQALVDEKFNRLLASRLAESIDAYCIESDIIRAGQPARIDAQKIAELHDKTPRNHAISTLRSEQDACRSSHERSPLIDCDVALFIRAHPLSGRLFGEVQEENVGVREAMLALPGVRDYAYWDNTDRPEDVEDCAWQRRGQDWREVLDELAPACLSMRWQADSMLFYQREFAKHLPKKEARIKHQALFSVQEQAIDQLKPVDPARRTGLAWVAQIMREVGQGVKDKNGPWFTLYEQRCAHYAALLPDELLPLVDRPFHELIVKP